MSEVKKLATFDYEVGFSGCSFAIQKSRDVMFGMQLDNLGMSVRYSADSIMVSIEKEGSKERIDLPLILDLVSSRRVDCYNELKAALSEKFPSVEYFWEMLMVLCALKCPGIESRYITPNDTTLSEIIGTLEYYSENRSSTFMRLVNGKSIGKIEVKKLAEFLHEEKLVPTQNEIYKALQLTVIAFDTVKRRVRS